VESPAPDDHSVSIEMGEAVSLEAVISEHRTGPDSSDAPVETNAVMPKRKGFAFTLLDGTTLQLPLPRAAKRRPSRAQYSAPREGREQFPEPAPPSSKPPVDPSEYHAVGQDASLTARDVISALRAASHGVDPADILGRNARWEALFSALLSLLLQRGVIEDDEFIEELKRI